MIVLRRERVEPFRQIDGATASVNQKTSPKIMFGVLVVVLSSDRSCRKAIVVLDYKLTTLHNLRMYLHQCIALSW
jgi:hypothetical protein